MHYIRKPGICIFYSIILTALFASVSISEGAMPNYQRLSPITSKVNSPTAVAVDSNGNVYVTESSENRLLVYTQSRTYINSLLGLNRPVSVAVDDNGRVFIGNHYDTLNNNGNVEVYDADLNFLFKLGAGDGEFSQPRAIAIDNSSGYIYVVDKKNNVVQVYETNGGHAFSFDGTLNGGGQLYKPTSIVIDSGELIVLDHPLTLTQDDQGNDVWVNGARIQFFEMTGVYKDGFNKYGNNVGDMHKPVHIGIDNEGRIYVSDTQHNVVLVYDRNGEYLGAVYDTENPLRTPLGITISNGNILYVASRISGWVESYGITPFAQMGIDPLSLSWEEQRGSEPSAQSVHISNNGDKSVGWAVLASNSWITLSDTFGIVGPYDSHDLSIGIDLTGLQPGTFTGSVSISADFGAAETVSIELILSEVPLIANPNGPYSVTEGHTVVLDGSGSSGVVVLYEWDINDDGTYDYSSAQPLQEHLFVDSGTYMVRLRVTDDFGVKDDAAVIVDVMDTVPTASFSSTQDDSGPPYTVNFTNSSTAYDQPLSYEWDFDNDELADSNLVNPSYVYDHPGTYAAQLTVTDSDGSIVSLIMTQYIAATDESGCTDAYVKSEAVGYSSLQDAYTEASNGALIMARSINLGETLSFDRALNVTISGGHNCDYTAKEGKTIISGNVTVSSGVLILEDFILE
jgi:PKD repeat protein